MHKSEQRFHTEAMRWIKYNLHLLPKSFLMESKVVRSGETRFPYRELSEKEERLLLRAKHGTVIQTHSDLGGMGTLCDGSVISGGGLIFLQWTRPRNKEFYIIDIDDFIKQRETSTMKSLSEQEARLIGRAYLFS